jgi:hypothetical protein
MLQPIFALQRTAQLLHHLVVFRHCVVGDPKLMFEVGSAFFGN